MSGVAMLSLPAVSRLSSRIVATALVCACLAVPAASAQEPAKPSEPGQISGPAVAAAEEQTKPTGAFFPALFHNLGDDLKKMPRKNSLYWLVGGSALALAVHPGDDTLDQRLRGSAGAETFFKGGKYVGGLPVLMGASVGTYLIGRGKGYGRARHLGMDLIEATILSEGITQILKSTIRRDRPVRDDGKRSGGYAFPSGHAAGTFAAATVLQQHLGWKAAVPTYTIATYVAISRLHDQRHFASDVAFGAAEGIIVGRSVTWHGRNFYASPLLTPKGAGVMVSVLPAQMKRGS
ncbi:MAG: phosphatase PAP2 family protein [Acidobacteriota bacterium]